MSTNEDDLADDSDKGERKRQREKQRRSDLASAFEDLQATLSRVELGVDGFSRLANVDSADMPVTRLGLVLQTTETLRRLHQENMNMRLVLGGQWTDDSAKPHPTWRMDHGHSQHYQQPNYFPGYADAHPPHGLPPSHQHHAYNNNGYYELWDRGPQNRPHQRFDSSNNNAPGQPIPPTSYGKGFNQSHSSSSNVT